MKLVLAAIMLSIPLAWYLMNTWLKGFESQITLDGWTFTFAVVGVVIIALITFSFQTIKAALMNPVSSLKAE